MNRQAEILEWYLQSHLGADILTIKNPAYVESMKKLLSQGQNERPVDRMSIGFSQSEVQNVKGFYVRDNFRYKKRKQEKKQMDKVLLQNITISRVHPCILSIKKSFIESEQLRKCMLLYSDEMAFHYIEIKQIIVKIGGGKFQSLWFRHKEFKSFSQWFIFFLQMEMYEAFKEFSAKKLLKGINHFTFVEETIKKEELKKWLQSILRGMVDGRFPIGKNSHQIQSIFQQQQEEKDEKLEIKKQEVPYLLQRCLQKFQTERSLGQVVFEYQWYCEDRKSKVNRVLKQLCKIIVKKFRDEEISRKAQQLQEMGNHKNKKKRKNHKKSQLEKSQNSEEKSEGCNSSKKSENIQSKQKIEEIKKELSEERPPELFDSKITQSQTPQKHPKSKKKTKPQNGLEKMVKIERQISPKIPLSDHKHPPEYKKQKVINQRINQYITNFHQQLVLSSQSIDRYRKVCLQTIEQCLKDMGLKSEWKVLLFGSYSIEFSLRGSDLDVVIVVDDPEVISLRLIQEHFRVQQWLRRCNVTQIQSAKVDILEFEIILSQLKHPKAKDNKKIKEVIHVDMSLVGKENQHQGLINTSIMKQIFSQFHDLKVVDLIFKELLSIYKLNKPFNGGIGSYHLVIMTHNIMKMKNLSIEGDYFKFMMEICEFMTEKFQPFKTLIASSNDSKLNSNPKLELNIQDPKDNSLINTTKIRQINEIIQLFNQFKKMLRQAESELLQINVQERKKMKRVFFQYWNILFRPNEQI